MQADARHGSALHPPVHPPAHPCIHPCTQFFIQHPAPAQFQCLTAWLAASKLQCSSCPCLPAFLFPCLAARLLASQRVLPRLDSQWEDHLDADAREDASDAEGGVDAPVAARNDDAADQRHTALVLRHLLHQVRHPPVHTLATDCAASESSAPRVSSKPTVDRSRMPSPSAWTHAFLPCSVHVTPILCSDGHGRMQG